MRERSDKLGLSLLPSPPCASGNGQARAQKTVGSTGNIARQAGTNLGIEWVTGARRCSMRDRVEHCHLGSERGLAIEVIETVSWPKKRILMSVSPSPEPPGAWYGL